jgi:hypothetical protein
LQKEEEEEGEVVAVTPPEAPMNKNILNHRIMH